MTLCGFTWEPKRSRKYQEVTVDAQWQIGPFFKLIVEQNTRHSQYVAMSSQHLLRGPALQYLSRKPRSVFAFLSKPSSGLHSEWTHLSYCTAPGPQHLPGAEGAGPCVTHELSLSDSRDVLMSLVLSHMQVFICVWSRVYHESLFTGTISCLCGAASHVASCFQLTKINCMQISIKGVIILIADKFTSLSICRGELVTDYRERIGVDRKDSNF